MSLLLEPNIAYLVLVAGVLVALLALVSPGSGLLEVGALFLLLFAGYSVYNLPVNLWALGMLLVGAVFFGFSVRRPTGMPFLIFALAALVVGSVFLFRAEGGQPAVNLLLATVTSLLLTGFLFLSARKSLEAITRQPSHKLLSVIGAEGETRSAIYQEGSVYVLGELWSARSTHPIAVDTPIRVVGRDGFILVVEPVVQAAPEAKLVQ